MFRKPLDMHGMAAMSSDQHTRLMLGSSAFALAAAAMLPVGGDSALQWLVDLCLPGSAPMPEGMDPIAMETHGTHFATKAAAVMAVAAGVLVFAGLRTATADPDRMLAAMAYMANAMPEVDPDALSSAVTRATGYALTHDDATKALACYTGHPRQDDLAWIAEDRNAAVAREILAAAMTVGRAGDAFPKPALRTLGALANAFHVSGEELIGLARAQRASETSDQASLDPFPVLDDVSHWIRGVLSPFRHQIKIVRTGEIA